MKKLLIAALILPAFSGCMKVREEFVVMPDGSGKLTLLFTIQAQGEAAKFTQDELMAGGVVQREARRVRPAVLHRLEHRCDVAPDAVRTVAVPVDDAGDPAHGYGSTSRYSSRSQSVTAAR